ncbi:MAG: hypothetical protein J6B24_06905 [Clostridia bacterium]|nr:hypothetical protein [Clostridia bacterium]
MSDTNHTATPVETPVETANEVVTAEVKVAQGSHKTEPLSPAAEKLAEELYKNMSMGCDAYLDMLPRVEDNRLKTDITAAMCYYEKTIGKVKQYLLDHGADPEERGMMAKMATKAGIMMNTAMDNSNSHITEMLIEGATMSITTAEKLANHAEGKPECHELVDICRDWAKFEQNHIDALKKYL